MTNPNPGVWQVMWPDRVIANGWFLVSSEGGEGESADYDPVRFRVEGRYADTDGGWRPLQPFGSTFGQVWTSSTP